MKPSQPSSKMNMTFASKPASVSVQDNWLRNILKNGSNSAVESQIVTRVHETVYASFAKARDSSAAKPAVH